MDLSKWLEERSDGIGARWADTIMGIRPTDAVFQAVGPLFCSTLVSFLPGVLTAYRHQIEPLWREASSLFGAVAARRGLSAGEVIEEFHELRDGLIRLTFEEPPIAAGGRLSLREVLHLNRTLDVGVTQASIGHTDLMFFSLIHGSGVPAPMESHDLQEVRVQLNTMGEEGVKIMRMLAHADRS